MFDTHCHLNFSKFSTNYNEVIKRANDVGIDKIIIPGTDIVTSLRALEIANQYEGVYVAVGIHPHHAYEIKEIKQKQEEICQLEKMLSCKKVVAIGEVGLDYHTYQKTKYEKYEVNSEFIKEQKELLSLQIKLAIKYKKSLILHNREAKKDMLTLLNDIWDPILEKHTVFHCCEPDEELLEYTKEHKMFIGVDGDVTYSKIKKEFVKKIPLDMLVLETDSPYLLPEPLRSQKKYPNEPKNIAVIAEYISKLKKEKINNIQEITSKNANELFNLKE